MTENRILQSLEELKETEYPIYVWAGGTLGYKIAQLYKKHGIEIAGYLVDSGYKPGCFTDGKEELCFSDFFRSLDFTIDLIVGCSSAWTKKMANEFDRTHIHKIYDGDIAAALCGSEEFNTYDERFWNENRSGFMESREKLCDEESKEAFDEFIYQKRTAIHWKPFSKDIQYFDKNIMKFHDREVMVDVGCLDGGTAIEFKKALERQGIHTYKEIIALEPSAIWIAFIENRMEKLPDFRLIKKGAWDKKDVLRFSADHGGNSLITNEGNTEIEVDTIDNMLGDTAATFIKMDIEGSELKALQGAKNQISKNRPKLAVSVYHRKTDLIDIPTYLLSLVPDYKLYLRSYRSGGFETVLYAI